MKTNDVATPTPTTNQPAQIKIKTPADLFSILPYALGYHPEESLLVVCIRPHGGLGMIARTSLSDLIISDQSDDLIQMVARSATADQAVRAFIVIYTAATDEFTIHTYRKLAKSFSSALSPISSESWVINSEKYFRLDCQGSGCCPPGGYTVGELGNTEASTALVFRGYAPARSRSEYLKIPVTPVKDRASAQTAARSLVYQQGQAQVGQSWRVKAFAQWQQALEQAALGAKIPAPVLGTLGAALKDTTMRDAILVSCLPKGRRIAEALIADRKSAPQAASALLAKVIGSDGDFEQAHRPGSATSALPHRELIRNATTVLELVVSHARRNCQSAPLTLLAFLAWLIGDGTRANTRVRQALDADSNNQLAVTLAQAIECHLQPTWIRNRNLEVLQAAA